MQSHFGADVASAQRRFLYFFADLTKLMHLITINPATHDACVMLTRMRTTRGFIIVLGLGENDGNEQRP